VKIALRASVLWIGTLMFVRDAAAAGAGSLGGRNTVRSTDSAEVGPCASKRFDAAVDLTVLPDGTFNARLPYVAPERVAELIAVEGSTVTSDRVTTLDLDAESLDAIASTIGIDRCRGGNPANLSKVSVAVRTATLAINKRQTSAKLNLEMSVVTQYRQPHGTEVVTVTYTLKVKGTWMPDDAPLSP